MKMTKLRSLVKALETGEEEITIPDEMAARALAPVERMLAIGK